MENGIARVNRLILEVVTNQLDANKPPQTRETFERLVGRGFAEEDAKHLIGSAVVSEMRAVVAEGRPFKEERYLELLKNLPETV